MLGRPGRGEAVKRRLDRVGVGIVDQVQAALAVAAPAQHGLGETDLAGEAAKLVALLRVGEEDHLFRAVGEGGGEEVEADLRSEEHTSELQSLMRISYAVFCLKKKRQKSNSPSTKQTY